jgi:lysophospholipase L1-like esterase
MSVMPPHYHPGGGYQWHPLLQAQPIPKLEGRVDRVKVTHSSAGTRGRDWTADDLAGRKVVAVFGGSTTYDLAVGDGETWPDQLEERLGGIAAVINHGVPGYSTVENLLQTAFYADAFGRAPDCAVYYVGWNDLASAGFDHLDNAYAHRHLRSQIDSLKVRRIPGDFHTPSPIATVLIRLAAALLDTNRPALGLEGEVLDGPDERLERLFLRNTSAISAINRSRGIRTVWVGQLLNVHALEGEEAHGWTPLIRQKDLWPMQSRLNGLLRQQAEAQGDSYIDVPIDDFSNGDFADAGHFSPSGSARFATHLARRLPAWCR